MKHTYTDRDISEIAAAVGISTAELALHRQRFENAADWYLLAFRRPKRTAPSKLIEKLRSIRGNARRLLRSLGINSAGDACDGNADTEILEALVLSGESSGDPAEEAVRRIGRLVEIIEGIEATAELKRRSEQGEQDVVLIGKLTVRRGNAGDDALNDWIAAMLPIYKDVTGSEPGTSVAMSGPREGIAEGPLIRFLKAAAKPLGLSYSEDALRRRIRDLIKASKATSTTDSEHSKGLTSPHKI